MVFGLFISSLIALNEPSAPPRLIVRIYHPPPQMRYQHALAAISEVEGRGVVKGEVYRVRVLKVVDFSAYVTLPNGMPAMLHISELCPALNEKIREVRDVISEGQEFVMCKGRNSKGFVQLSLKAMQQGPDDQEGQDRAAAGGSQKSRGPAEGGQGSTIVADAAAAAGAPTGSLQDRLAAAVAAASAVSASQLRVHPPGPVQQCQLQLLVRTDCPGCNRMTVFETSSSYTLPVRSLCRSSKCILVPKEHNQANLGELCSLP
jgi:predicted RNA-binding protein with RPS1 domain